MKRRRHAHPVVEVKNRKIDLPLLVSVIALVIAGLIMVYDSSVVQAYKDYGDKYFYIRQQLIWAALGFGLLGFFSFFNYQNLKKLALPGLIISVVLLLAVLVPGLGTSAGGAHRWLRIGFFSIQPAEIIKLTGIIFFAYLFENKPRLGPFLGVVVLVCLIIGVLQRDLGSTGVFFFISLVMYVISGLPLTQLWGFIPISFLGLTGFVMTSAYRKNRILAFLDPFSDPQGYTYHISQVLIALGSGGLLGLGLGQSRQKFEYIPEVTTDSIFAIVGEEFGFVGGIMLILLIAFFVHRGLKIAESVNDNFGRLLAFGLVSWLGIQAIINLAAMVSLIPLTGVPLPFVSYGGSALLTNLVAVGILLNISRSTNL